MKVVIVGGGFAGIKAARILKKKFQVTIIEQNDYFTFKPLLHEFIVGSMPFDTICYPIQESAGKGVTFIKGVASDVDSENRSISVKTIDNSALIKIPYDYLLVTTGAIPNLLENNDLSHPYDMMNAKIMKEQMVIIRDRIKNHEKLSIGIVGAGPVGIEIAFVVKEFLEYHSKLYHNANTHSIIIYNSSEDILSNFSLKIASLTRSQLIMNGIKTENFCLVRKVEKKNDYFNIHYQRDEKLHVAKHDIVFWSAGITKSKLGLLSFETDRFLRSKHNRHIFAAGDAAIIEMKKKRVPELAQLAVIQGELAAKNIIRASNSKKLIPYKLKLKGLMLTIGHKNEVGIIGKRIVLRGFFAWWLHRTVYLMQIYTFKRKMHNINVWSKDLFNTRYIHLDEEKENVL
jgi:NADH:ubiquinone reductase (H+-translocating)